MPFLAPLVGGATAGFLGDNASSIIGGIGGALESGGPQAVPFQGGSAAQPLMDEFMRTLRGALQREQYLSNQPQIAYGLPGVEGLSQQQYNIPGLDMSLGFSPAVTQMFAQPRMISPGLDAAYWDQSLPPDQRKQTGDEPWRQIADSLISNIAFSPLSQASQMAPPIVPPQVGPPTDRSREIEQDVRRGRGVS